MHLLRAPMKAGEGGCCCWGKAHDPEVLLGELQWGELGAWSQSPHPFPEGGAHPPSPGTHSPLLHPLQEVPGLTLNFFWYTSWLFCMENQRLQKRRDGHQQRSPSPAGRHSAQARGRQAGHTSAGHCPRERRVPIPGGACSPWRGLWQVNPQLPPSLGEVGV